MEILYTVAAMVVHSKVVEFSIVSLLVLLTSFR